MNGLVDLRGPWSAIVRAPMVRIAVPLITGIALALWGQVTLYNTLLIMLAITPAAALVLLFPAWHLTRWQRGITVSIWFLCFGMFWQALRDPPAHPLHISHYAGTEGPWALRITAVNGTSAKVFRADAEVLAWMGGPQLEERRGHVMLALMYDSTHVAPKLGDRVLVDAPLHAIDRTPDPGGFDRRAWAASRGMAHELFAPVEDWRYVDHVTHWTGLFSGARASISTWLNGSELPERERALVKALVLGQRDELDGSQKQAFARSGTIHVLAVSGMHVGLIFAILSFVLGWWGGDKRARYVRGVFILLALWCYAGLTGASPSVLRATIMFSLFTFANMGEQRTDHLNSLFAAAFIQLVLDPHMLVVIGFQLSFLAVFGIILFYKPLRNLWLPESKILNAIWALAVVSMSAQLLTGPLSIYLFKAFPVWFLPANIVVVTAVGLAVNGAVALLLLYKVPVIGGVLTWALTLLLQGVGIITGFIAELPGAYPDIRISAWATVLLYLVMLGAMAWWQWGWRSMRWVMLASGLLLLGNWLMQIQAVEERASFTVYDSGATPMAAISHGRELTVLCDPDSLAARPALAVRVARHRSAHGLWEASWLEPTALRATAVSEVGATVAGAGLWLSPRFRVASLDAGMPFPTVAREQPLDVLLVSDARGLAQVTDSMLLANTRQIVLWGRVSRWARTKIRDRCQVLNIPFHDVREQGAFTLLR